MRSSQRLLRRSAAWLHQCTSQAQSEGVLPICGGTCQAWRGQGASDAQAPSARQQLRQYAADAAAAAVAAPDGADASLLAPDANPDITKLKGILARSRAGTDLANLDQEGNIRVLRFSDLPATTELVESFQGASPPTTPLYDLSAWLNSTYPEYGTRPRSPLYDWVTWMHENLSPQDVQAYIALDKHWQDRKQRDAILSKAQWELSRLWHWQHRRAALGLPAEPTDAERAAAIDAASARRAAATRAALLEARDLLIRAEATRTKAAEQTGVDKTVSEAEVAYLTAQAVEAYVRACFTAPTVEETITLRTMAAALKHVHSINQTVHKLADELRDLKARVSNPADAITAQMTALSADVSAPGQETESLAQQALNKQKQLEYKLGKLERLSEAMVLEMQAATQTSLKQLSTTLPAWQADKRRAADEDLAGVVQAVRAADAAPAMQAAGSTGILAAMQSHSSQPGVKVATKGKDDASGAARPASGMLAAMQAYANLGSAEFTPQQVKLLKSVGISDEQLKVLQRLRRLPEIDTTASTAKILDSISLVLTDSAKALKRRVKSSGYGAEGSKRATDRLALMLEEEAQKRKDSKSGRVRLYEDKNTTTTRPPTHTATGADGPKVLDGALVTALARVAMERKGVNAANQGDGEAADRSLLDRYKERHGNWLLGPDAQPAFVSDPTLRQPYVFDLRLRPPTHTLDLVTDYLQVRYQDVIVRRDAVARVESAMAGGVTGPNAATSHNSDNNTLVSHGAGTSGGSTRRALSPPEVSELNRTATQLFESGDMAGYTQLINRLATDGFLNPEEVIQLVTAAQEHANGLGGQAGDSTQGASTQETITDTSSSQAAVTVSPADRNALAALLASPTRAAFSASAASPEAVAAARAEWTRALTSGTCAPQSPWTATLVEKISRATQISAKPVDAPASQQSANTQSDMGAATRGITARITKGEQVSWEEACRLWDEYITQVAADPVERGALPSLADVINADAQLRQARSQAAAKAPGAAAALAAATERAAVINTQLDFAHRRFLERHPGGTFPLTAPGASTSGRGVAAATGVEAGMQRLRQFNNTLTKAFRAPAAMLTSFQDAPNPRDVIKSHIESTSRKHLGRTLAWRDDTPVWDQVWGLLRSLYTHYLTTDTTTTTTSQGQTHNNSSVSHNSGSDLQQLEGEGEGEGGEGGRKKKRKSRVQMTIDAAAAAGAEEGQGGGKGAKGQGVGANTAQEARWRAYCAAQEQRAQTAASAPVSSGYTWAPQDAQLAPPYPGARPILRFSQCVVLGPASSMSSTQGLADRVEFRSQTHAIAAQRTGYSPPAVLLPDHPAAKRVVLRVQVRDLAEEVGLTEEGIQHLLRIAGVSRYDEDSGDLVLLGAKYRTREDNRRWCLEALHLMLHEAHRLQGSLGAQGAAAQTEFLLERPGVASLLHGRA